MLFPNLGQFICFPFYISIYFALNISFQLTRNTIRGIRALSCANVCFDFNFFLVYRCGLMSLNNTKIGHFVGKHEVGEEYTQKIQEPSPCWTPLYVLTYVGTPSSSIALNNTCIWICLPHTFRYIGSPLGTSEINLT